MNLKNNAEEKVFAYIREHRMLAPGEKVIAGVSGGADSVCLLFVLLEWAKRTPLELGVVHVNHGLRPDAGEDEAYVEALCRSHGLPFFPVHADMRGRAQEEKLSEEEAGRKIRYEAFAQAAERFGAGRIAVAHNGNDQAETMLFHLFRGTGPAGLCGIRPVRERIIRPILCLERQEIEEYLAEKGIAYCHDGTNDSDDYARNRIRHHILPAAEQDVSGGCVRHMMRTARLMAEEEDFLAGLTQDARAGCVRPEKGAFRISAPDFLKQPAVLQKRLLHVLVKELTPSCQDISFSHLTALLTLFTREENRTICLPFGIRGCKRYGEVLLTVENAAARKQPLLQYGISPADIPEKGLVVPLPGLGELEFRLISRKKGEDIPQKRCTKWFDCDKMIKSLMLRTRSPGDYLTVKGPQGLIHKSLQDYLVNEKIPRDKRDCLPVLAEDSHIVWVVGCRISEFYKVDGNTKRILQVQLREGCTCGKTEEKNGGTYQSIID